MADSLITAGIDVGPDRITVSIVSASAAGVAMATYGFVAAFLADRSEAKQGDCCRCKSADDGLALRVSLSADSSPAKPE